MFKVKGQRSRSQRKVRYQQQKRYNAAIGWVRRHQTWHGVVTKAGKGWRGSDDHLKKNVPSIIISPGAASVTYHLQPVRCVTIMCVAVTEFHALGFG